MWRFSLCNAISVCQAYRRNIKRNLPKNITETKKKEILVYIFDNDTKGLIDCETIEEYKNKLKDFYEILSLDKELTVF